MAAHDGLPIIDSHLHLYAANDIQGIAWIGDLPPDHLLNRQNSLNEYNSSLGDNRRKVKGFVFVETNRKSSTESGVSNEGWQHPLNEISFLERIASGQLSGSEDIFKTAKLCAGIVPWAPVPGGPPAMEKYMAQAWAIVDKNHQGSKIKGVRYLLQDKPAGTMLKPDFVASLKWLGEHDIAFDLGIDARQGGLWQLHEAVQLLESIYDGVGATKRTTVVINHMCKPDMRLDPESAPKSAFFKEWSSCIEKMASFPNTFMKLSGGFSEMYPQSENEELDMEYVLDHLKPWTSAVFSAFRPHRILFGSDWPVCNVGGRGPTHAWSDWRHVITRILQGLGLSTEEEAMVWARTAMKAYNLEVVAL